MMRSENLTNVIKVYLDKPFDRFYVLILPMDEAPDDGKDWRDFYLFAEKSGHVLSMFGLAVESDDDAKELAYYNGIEYIPMWIEELNALESHFIEKLEK